jgi:hypothetical protein
MNEFGHGLDNERSESDEQNTSDQLRESGIYFHDSALAGEPDAADKSFSAFSELKKIMPDDYEVLAYLGSARTMVARDMSNPIARISECKKGLAMLDKAVQQDEHNYLIRLIRANNSLALPDNFKRKKKAKEDLLYLIDLIDKDLVPLEFQADTYFKLARVVIDSGDKVNGRLYLEKCIELSRESELSIQAVDAINKLT